MANDPTASPFWPADNPAVTAHINLLQGIINRLANNSASCKTWCLALVAAFLSLAGAAHQPNIIAFSLIPIVIFAFLDAAYLAQERAYRELYRKLTAKISTNTYTIDDAFDARALITFAGFCRAFTSWSIYPIYATLLLAYAVALSQGWLILLNLPTK